MGEGGAQAPGRRHAAVGHAASRRGDARGPPHLARAAARRGGGHAEPGPSRAPSPEPHRVPQRRARSAGARHRRRVVAAAARRLGLRVRQDRRLPRRVTGAPGALPVGGRAHQLAGGRRPGRRSRLRHLHRAPGPVAGQARGRHAVRHRRRHQGHAHLPGGRRVRPPGHALPHQRGPDPRARAHAPDRDHGGRRARLPADDRRHAPRQSRRRGRGRDRPRPPALALGCDRRPAAGAGSGEGRSARRHRRVPAAVPRRRLAQAAAVPELLRYLRCERLPARPDAGGDGAVQRRRAGRDAEPRAHLHVPACRGRAGRAVRAPDSHDAGAARLPAAGVDPGREPRHGVLPRGPGGWRRLRDRDPAGLAAHSREPEVRASRRAGSGGRAGRRRLPRHRLRAGVAPVLLPVEQHPGRRAAEPGGERAAPRSARARAAGAPDASRPAVARAGRQFRGPVAAAAEPAARDAGQRSVPASSTTTCARPSAARSSCCSRRSCARTAASSIC